MTEGPESNEELLSPRESMSRALRGSNRVPETELDAGFMLRAANAWSLRSLRRLTLLISSLLSGLLARCCCLGCCCDFFFVTQVHSPVTWHGQLFACPPLRPQRHLTCELRMRRTSRQCPHWVDGRPLGLICVSGISVCVQVVTRCPRMHRSHAYLTPFINTIGIN